MTDADVDPPPPISFIELLRRIDDMSIASEELLPYLILVPDPGGSIDPAFQPNPSRVTGLNSGLEGGVIVGSFNRRERRIRNKAFADKIAAGWTGLRLLDEGDSWFQYPVNFRGMRDIVDHLAQDHAVYSLSGAGHLLAEMLQQNEAIGAISRVKPHALLLSAGGNDLFDDGNIAELVELVPGGVKLGEKFTPFLNQVIDDYRSFLSAVHSAFPKLHMFIHGYSAAFSRGSRWIGQPLARKGVRDRTAQNQIVKLMLDRFNEAQIALAAEPRFHGKLIHVDLRALGRDPDDWHDEIHMGAAANRQAADLFTKALKDAGVGTSGGLESGTLDVAEVAPPTATEEVAAHAMQLSALGEDMLLAELQARLDLIDRDPEAASIPVAPLQVLAGGLESGQVPAAGPLARRLVRRWERELHELICGQGEEDSAERKQIVDALGVGQDVLIGALTTWLISGPLGISALLAGVLAAILVKRFGTATLEELCVAWKERLDGLA